MRRTAKLELASCEVNLFDPRAMVSPRNQSPPGKRDSADSCERIDLDIDVSLDKALTARTRVRPAGQERLEEAKQSSPDRRSQLMTKFARIIADTQMSDEAQLLEHLQRNIERQLCTNSLPTLPTLEQ